MPTNIYGGMLSGTSMDGVDVAFAEISEPAPDEFALCPLYFATIAYPPKLEKALRSIIAKQTAQLADLTSLQLETSAFFAAAFNRVLKKAKIPRENISAIGSHGQSLYHLPPTKNGCGYSWQIGNTSTIANLTGVETIGDFRAADMAAGGFGAPLAPIFHYYFLKQTRTFAIVVNIGGIANVSIVNDFQNWNSLRGFDTGPGNTLIDRAMQRLFNRPFDRNGACGSRGRIDEALVHRLLNAPFFKQRGPKSTGLEFFSEVYLDSLLTQAKKVCANKKDIIATITALTSHSIARQIQPFFDDHRLKTVILCGGGAKNKTLRKQLAALLPPDIALKPFDEFGLSGDAVEAHLFAFLAYLNQKRRCLNLKHITGARQPVILGVVSPKLH